MSITRMTGPLVISGVGPQGSGALDYNDSPGPSAFAHGVGLVDGRRGPFGGVDIATPIPIWYGSDSIAVLNQAPATLSATNLAAAQVPVAGTPMTLAGASTGITVLTAPYAFGQNTFPTGARVIDGNPAFITLSPAGGGISAYDPRTMIGRCVRITSAGADTGTIGLVFLDVYGDLAHETVTMAGIGVVTSKKPMKAMISATPNGTLSGSNISIGTSDVYDIPLAAYDFPWLRILWAGTLISASTGFTAAVTTSPATAITGATRGTYATQSASNGTNALQIFVTPAAWHMDMAGLFGVTNF
jgi:hypothetical protein